MGRDLDQAARPLQCPGKRPSSVGRPPDCNGVGCSPAPQQASSRRARALRALVRWLSGRMEAAGLGKTYQGVSL